MSAMRMRKPVEANDGSYGGLVLAAFDALEDNQPRSNTMAVDTDFERQLHRHMQGAPAGSLFETFKDKAMRRVEEILHAGDSRWPLDGAQELFLNLIKKHQGRGRSVPLSEIAGRMHCTPRTVKDIVREMRLNFGVLICSSRGDDGYWLAANEEEVRESMRPYFAQAMSELRVFHAMNRNVQSIDEMLSQIRLELTTGEQSRG